ncbi:DnaJ C-terminal domain-containing protein [Mangrovibrevibacter kandeliae]|uniref:DnaJ C-terminal domain-containing protein n=1 Tax=Mangrovibrevibacter kandeliae TaxID=2968473 RepID=UPI002119B6F3|nr:J domain-containing protein [Aurantimonas sp. CSK15Z-1]MCQ8780719.1 J domain-containing protein [Aurantimonas sp. CSK15Z-1]
MRDLYAVLGVAKSADEKEIKSAFRKLAKQYHPDANADDPAAGTRFNEINQAYEILGDKDKRAKYDSGEIDAEGKPKFTGFPGGSPFGARAGGTRSHNFNFGGGPGGAGAGADAFTDPDSPFADLFEQALGGAFGRGGRPPRGGGFAGARSASMRGEDLRANLKVRLEDVVSEDKVEAVFPTGKRLAIRLPEGVENGQVIRLRGQGQPAPFDGGQPGDALVTIELVKHPRFEVTGRDLTLDLAVPVEDAVLGGKLQVDTLDGRVSISVPAWSSSGKTLRLKGKGLTRKEGGRGDILVRLQIALPAEPDEALIAFLRERGRKAA